MTDVTIDLDLLNKSLTPDFGTVQLIPGLSLGDTEPSTLPTVPSVMADFELVANSKYRYSFNLFRYMHFGYLLQRDGEWETGELLILSDATYVNSIDPQTYVLPTLSIEQTVKISTASLGVELSVITDSLSVSSDPSFGIAYKITNATPAVFPTLRMYLIKGLDLKETA